MSSTVTKVSIPPTGEIEIFSVCEKYSIASRSAVVYSDKSDTYNCQILHVRSVYDYTLQLISSTPDKEGESCAGNNPLLVGVLGGVMCLIIVSQSLVIVYLLLWQKRLLRLDNTSPPFYHLTSSLYTLCCSFII